MNFFKQLINAMFPAKKEKQQLKESPPYVFQVDDTCCDSDDFFDYQAEEFKEKKPVRKKRATTKKVVRKTSGKR